MNQNPFEKALEVMRERGMCKFAQQDKDGHVCLYGALSIVLWGRTNAATNYPDHEIMDKAALNLFPERASVEGYSAAPVNNHPDTTQEDVELILKHSAYEWEILYGESEV